MQHSAPSAAAQHQQRDSAESNTSSRRAQGNQDQHQQQLHPDERLLGQNPQPQQSSSEQQHTRSHQLQLSTSEAPAMAAGARIDCAPSVARGPVHGPLRPSVDEFGSGVAERSLGQQLHQLSFDLKEQLYVDTKRTRTAPVCCSHCKPSTASETPSTTPCRQTSVLPASTGAPGAPHIAAEVSQANVPPASAGDAGAGCAAETRRRRSGDNCCLTCSCPCHDSSSRGSSSIICFEGPRRPPTFASNLAELCRAFPSVHQGLIVSLLETAENDLQRAHALVRVVSDTNTGLHNPKTGGPMTKRKRCPDADTDCLGACSLDAPAGRASPLRADGARGEGEGDREGRRGSSSMDVAGPIAGEQQLLQVAAAAAADPAARRLLGPGGELPEAWCNEVAERLLWAIVTAASGDDAKAKAAALLREHSSQLAHAHHDEPSQAELAREAERQELAKKVELLQNDKLLLARAVKAQHEKLQLLQQNLASKTEEARHLMQELRGAQQTLRSLRDAASALLVGTTTPPGHNSPCRDNGFDRRFPDVF